MQYELTYSVKEVEGKKYIRFYLVMENGNYIQIKNCFKEDFSKLRLLAKRVEK